MFEKYPQGRLKVIQSTQSCLEWNYTWPKSENHSNEDARLILNMAIVWQYTDKVTSSSKWTIDAINEAIPLWLNIPTNFTMDEKVQKYSKEFLNGILEHLWQSNLQIKLIRKFERVFHKAEEVNLLFHLQNQMSDIS